MNKIKLLWNKFFDIFEYNLLNMKNLRIKFNPKIKVTSNGGFYIKSEDIFSDREKSRKQIDALKAITKKYMVKG